MSYSFVKSLHMTMAIVTIAGFVLRSYWMVVQSDKLLMKPTRVLPHIVDTVFLLSGIALVVQLNLNVLEHPWLLAKFGGLIVYIVLGAIAIKRGPTLRIRVTSFAAALVTFAYIAGVAINRSPASWLVT